MPFTIVTQGDFVSDGTAQKIPVPQSADYFKVWNYTQLGLNPNPGVGVMFEWFKDVTPQGGALTWTKTNSTNAMNADTVTSGGFTYVAAPPQPGAPVTGTAITAANPAVVTMNNSFSDGDVVRLYNTTGMLQIGGMAFTIDNVTATDFELPGLNSSGFAAPATNVVARKIDPVALVEPSFLYITGISQASEAVVTVSTAHRYVVGQLIRFSVPESFGMTEINGLTGEIVAVGTYTMTVNINSSAFTAFAFPASSGSPTTTLFATLAPAGQRTQYDPVTQVQTGYNFDFAPFHTGDFIPYMYLAAGTAGPAGSANDVIVWQAFKMET